VTIVRETLLPPDPLALARALGDQEGFAALVSGAPRPGDTDPGPSFLACNPVDRCEEWVPRELGGAGLPAWAGGAAAPRWIGAVPYEATRALERSGWTPRDARPACRFTRPAWLRYDAVLRVERGRVVVEADDAPAAERLVRAASRIGYAAPARLISRAGSVAIAAAERAHVGNVRAALDLIARGDLYQVNLARPIDLEVDGRPLDLFVALAAAAPSPFAFCVDFGPLGLAMGTSPELALEVRGDRLRTGPIKGTRPRGDDAASDAALAAALDADPKERAELTMAIDLHRNDLGRVAVPGTVRVLGVPRVVAGRTVWSRVADVVARRDPACDLEAVVRAVVPLGSVTGAPKVRAMEVIASLEPARRGLYTGAIGYVGRDGALVLAMAIRTLEVDPRAGAAVYWTGGGIVADSDPERELDETRWKAAHLFDLARPSPPRDKLVRVTALR
jgi:anthranilate/para-aminobenzoate synthase component I